MARPEPFGPCTTAALRRPWGVIKGFAAACISVGLMQVAAAQAPDAAAAPAFVQQTVSHRLALAGEGQMRFMGLRIYDARLWVAPGFDIDAHGEHPLALELTYHRAFKGEAIAKRSLVEIERQAPLAAERAAQWLQTLTRLLPDVQPGDRLTGVFDPQRGLRLWRGNQAIGAIDDVELAQRFFGIWLSPKTSEPGLRRSLVALRSGVAP